MSQEIIEAVREIERDKGIEQGTLVGALEDALLAAYKKMPGASRHATVELDENGDFRVYSIELPSDVEERLLVEALLPRSEQVDGERYEQGSRIKAVITEVRSGTKGPQVILSRRDPELIKTLFELEVPEIADGLVEIRGVAREPGYRSKIAVESHAQGVDPVGACVGPRGSRVRMVVSELRGEKIDIIPWNTEPARFVAKALSPARVREVYIDDETKEATVIVPEDQLALAIGKEGLNARLAARLTGWKVDIQSEAEFAAAEAEAAFGGGEEGEDFSGRCAAILSNGKRCPNAAIPGTRFCGIPAHAALADREAAGETIEAGQAVPIGGADEGPGAGGAQGGRSRCTGRRWEGTRRRLREPRAPAGSNLHRLRTEGSEGRTPAVRRRGRRGHLGPRGARPRRLHLPASLVLRAGRHEERLQPDAPPSRPGRSGPRGSLHLSVDHG